MLCNKIIISLYLITKHISVQGLIIFSQHHMCCEVVTNSTTGYWHWPLQKEIQAESSQWVCHLWVLMANQDGVKLKINFEGKNYYKLYTKSFNVTFSYMFQAWRSSSSCNVCILTNLLLITDTAHSAILSNVLVNFVTWLKFRSLCVLLWDYHYM